MSEQRQAQYLKLIEELLFCANGQEPEILTSSAELIDADFVTTLLQVSAKLAHENQSEEAQFLAELARLLSKNLGLYPQTVS